MKLCFVIMGFRKKVGADGIIYDLDKTYNNIIKPTVQKCGFKCIRGDEVKDSSLIDKSMYALLVHADLVIADITTLNPNALYELGIRHAARPFSTIIMRHNEGDIPFDISHNRIFHYKHDGDIIGHEETERCKTELADLITKVSRRNDVDSPFFESIADLPHHQLSEDQYHGLIKELAEKEEHIFGWTEHAKAEMKLAKGELTGEKFQNAARLWEKLAEKVKNEPYYIQQQAFCTYKSKLPDEEVALLDALQVIGQLDPEDKLTNNIETLGITGAIYKNLWLINKKEAFLQRAIDHYGKGFKMNNDYYTGENYALCLDFMSVHLMDSEEKIYHRIEARKAREKILEILKEYEFEEGFETRNDVKWIYASMANCLFALDQNNPGEEYQEKFYSKVTANWQKETYERSKQQLMELKNKQ